MAASATAKCYVCSWRHNRKNFVRCTQARGIDFYVTVCENCWRLSDLKERVEQKRAELQSEVIHAIV
jgi:hypothetical protein